MAFLSILCALLIEQVRPLRANNVVFGAIKMLSARIEAGFNAGQPRNGRLAWFVVVLLLAVPVYLIHLIAASINPLFELAWNVIVAYFTIGFRQYSHHFSSIQMALLSGDDVKARTLLAEWTGLDTVGMEVSDISRIAIEKALVTAHHSVFGVLLWFLLPIGPAGAVVYRVAEHLARAWNDPAQTTEDMFGVFASKAFYWADWIPVRLTAVAFAVVGNFEDAIYAWRNFARRWENETLGIILSAGGGALGIRLGNPAEKAISIPELDMTTGDYTNVELESMPGEEPMLRSLQSAVGLLWRATLLWLLLILLLSIAVWIG
ncbi:MAG: CobD/CbiB family protein [Oxalobacter sp.]|nr:MAG: CobD/CbiB family protein [Oxalobacter sp.]